MTAALLGIAVAYATKAAEPIEPLRSDETTEERTEAIAPPVEVEAPLVPSAGPTVRSPAPSASSSPRPAQSRPPLVRPPAVEASAEATPSESPRPVVRGVEGNLLTGFGVGPFRLGQAAAALLEADVARHPDSDEPCNAEAQLLATDPRYREGGSQTLSAHTVDGRIAHVTVFTSQHATRTGLRVGSSVAQIAELAPQARRFGDQKPSFLAEDVTGALLFVVRNNATAAVVVGSTAELTRIGAALALNPDDPAPLC